MRSKLLPRLVVPYTRRELPGWGRLLGLAGGYRQEDWSTAGTARVRGKWHGYMMTLDLADGCDRLAYFIARYHDLPSQLFIRAAVKKGETFVDVGANAGMMTLLGAGCVGSKGKVIAFEPNPVMFARLQADVGANALRHVQLHMAGLGDRPGELVLSVLGSDGSLGTFAQVEERGELAVTARHRVAVMRGDEVLADLPRAPVTIKIDVEGYECHVLRGLPRTLELHRPAVMTEALPWILERAGSGISELFGIMQGHGYRAYELGKNRKRFHYGLHLRQLAGVGDLQGSDIAWVHPDSVHAERIMPHLSG